MIIWAQITGKFKVLNGLIQIPNILRPVVSTQNIMSSVRRNYEITNIVRCGLHNVSCRHQDHFDHSR